MSIFIICQDFDNFPVSRCQVSHTDLFTLSLLRNGKHQLSPCCILLCLAGFPAHVITDYSFLNFNMQHNTFKPQTSHLTALNFSYPFPPIYKPFKVIKISSVFSKIFLSVTLMSTKNRSQDAMQVKPTLWLEIAANSSSDTG